MKKFLAFILGAVLICAPARAVDYAIYESTSWGLDDTWCYSRPYVGSAFNHAEVAAPGQTIPRIFVLPDGSGLWMYFNAIWLPIGNTITFFNGVFFESFGPYEKYALIFFQSDGIHLHLNPRTYDGIFWLPCEDFFSWELTPIGWRTYDP